LYQLVFLFFIIIIIITSTMSNTRNMNQAGNFWDFVASLQNNPGASSSAEFNPFENQEFWGPWAHRGRRHGPHGHRGPSEGNVPPPPHVDEHTSRSPSPHTPPETPAEPHHHPRPQSPRRGPHHHHEGPHRGRGRGRGPRGGHHNSHPHGGPSGFPFDLNALAEAFGPAFFGGNIFGGPDADGFPTTREEQSKDEQSKTVNKNEQPKTNTNDGTFTPSIDLFSTPTSYILHTSLPGAKKPDLDITYNSTRNSITISGVITRPDVSENMMNCLIQDERREVGMFEREIKLEDGVKIDEEKIGAKLEDGVLRVIVPKILEEEEGWESVRKVELE
jgi:HSP20 family protein